MDMVQNTLFSWLKTEWVEDTLNSKSTTVLLYSYKYYYNSYVSAADLFYSVYHNNVKALVSYKYLAFFLNLKSQMIVKERLVMYGCGMSHPVHCKCSNSDWDVCVFSSHRFPPRPKPLPGTCFGILKHLQWRPTPSWSNAHLTRRMSHHKAQPWFTLKDNSAFH